MSRYLTSLLSKLLVSVHASQRIIVADMNAGLLLQLAEMALRDMQRYKNQWNVASTARMVADEQRNNDAEPEYMRKRGKAIRYLEDALELYLGMQDGLYSDETRIQDGESSQRQPTQQATEYERLSPSLSAHGVDLRAVTSAASSLGSLFCEDGRHEEGLTLHYRRRTRCILPGLPRRFLPKCHRRRPSDHSSLTQYRCLQALGGRSLGIIGE